ncbi:DrmB family protein [Jatrophihabitans sp. YIM 134969]
MRKMRLSQTVSPFGVGSVLDVLGESLMGADISEWPYERTERVVIRRLELALGVSELRSPPSVPSYPSPNTPGLPYQRFPRWLFCQDCRRMRLLRASEETGEPPACAHCGGGLVPMRFIAVCTRRGHAMDVRWDRWAHSEATSDGQRRCKAPNLLFETRQSGTDGLSNLLVRCTTCSAQRDLGDLTVRDSLKRIGVRCSGRQPWQRDSGQQCDERVEVLQRGATNVTLTETTTALDIPEPSTAVRDVEGEIRSHRNFEDVRTAPTGPRAAVLIDLIAEDLSVSPDLIRRLAGEWHDTGEPEQEARTGLLTAEWDAFRQAFERQDETTGTPNFIISATRLADDDNRDAHRRLAEKVAHVVLVHRLREVRALHGFRRYDQQADLVDVDLGSRARARWLPAVESFGEGVFLALRQTGLQDWEGDEAVQRRAQRLERRRRDSLIGSRFDPVTPRLVLLHTFAHLLMRQMAFSSGYSSASLRERVYAGTDQEAGVLIYTAAGDAEGTLGGLVRQGQPPRLAETILAALEDASWCSADPICRESHGQGLGSLNLAGCHGCALVAETSCERSNVLLDRVLLVGDEDTPGYFAPVIDAVRSESITPS